MMSEDIAHKSAVTKTMDNELDYFKTSLSLVDVAASYGYGVDGQASSRNSIIMRGPGDDKIIVANHQGTYVYFSVRDETDNGTVIDFIQKRTQKTLGQVRKELRVFAGTSAPSVPSLLPRPEPSETNIPGVLAAYAAMTAAQDNLFLRQRGLTPATLASPRFATAMRQDKRSNIAFPHYGVEGLCGYELRNHGFYMFAKGGVKRTWLSTNLQSATTVFVVESAIDALSHAQCFPNDYAYLSIGGAMSPEQVIYVGTLVAGKHLIAGTDNDKDGEKFAQQLEALTGYAGFVRERPHKKDWNDLIYNNETKVCFP